MEKNYMNADEYVVSKLIEIEAENKQLKKEKERLEVALDIYQKDLDFIKSLNIFYLNKLDNESYYINTRTVSFDSWNGSKKETFARIVKIFDLKDEEENEQQE